MKEFGLTLYSADEKGANLYYDAQSNRRIRFTGAPNLGFLTTLDLNYIFRLLDRYGEQIPVDAPWTAEKAEG